MLRLARVVSQVSISMALGVVIALAYAWLLVPAATNGTLPRWLPADWIAAGPSVALLPVRLQLADGGDDAPSKSAIFDERQVAAIYRESAPAVVAVNVLGTNGQRRGLGSGFVIDPAGVVVTNYHVVRGSRALDVSLSDHAHFAAEVVGTDPQSDLAVLRLLDAPPGIPTLRLGDSSALEPGALAIAIGNPAGLERSVTVGVISGMNRTLRPTERPLRDVIQTDAAINPGNSGGPLLNSRGEVVGINTAIEAISGQRGFGGIGYAVPSSTVLRYLDRMLAGETIEHAWIGIEGIDVTPAVARAERLANSSGVLVRGVIADGPSAAAGLQPGDVITSVGGQLVRSMDELGMAIDGHRRPGDAVTVTATRGGKSVDLAVTLGTWPERAGAPR
jgi:serine protease Do